jgi:hypothetical protein
MLVRDSEEEDREGKGLGRGLEYHQRRNHVSLILDSFCYLNIHCAETLDYSPNYLPLNHFADDSETARAGFYIPMVYAAVALWMRRKDAANAIYLGN